MRFEARSVLRSLGVLLAVGGGVLFVLAARTALAMLGIALLVAIALNPAVVFFQRRRLRRSSAVAAVSGIALLVAALAGLVVLPPLIHQVGRFLDAAPALVADLTSGRGPLGFLETRYHVAEDVRRAVAGQGTGGVLREAFSAARAVKGVASTLVGMVLIAFLALFMLLEGPEWRRRVLTAIPPGNRPTAQRIGAGLYSAVGGFVAGSLLAAVLAGVVATGIMLVTGVPYAFPVGLFVAIIEFVPYVGPVVATLLVTAVAATAGAVTAVVVFVLLLVYHLAEGHTLRPVLYGRALRLSPLAVLAAILIGTEIAGILGTLAAVPLAGMVRVLVAELFAQRRGELPPPDEDVTMVVGRPGRGR